MPKISQRAHLALGIKKENQEMFIQKKEKPKNTLKFLNCEGKKT